jgi:hypothetical protein
VCVCVRVCVLTTNFSSQGYFFQQLQWSITTFIGNLDIANYIVNSTTVPSFFSSGKFTSSIMICYFAGTCKIINYLAPLMSCRISPSKICMPCSLICCQLTCSLILVHHNLQLKQNICNYLNRYLFTSQQYLFDLLYRILNMNYDDYCPVNLKF